MKIIDLYRDYGVDFLTEGHKHCRPGWVNTECPHCKDLPGSNPGYHMGFNLNGNYYYCWRCGWHPVNLTLVSILNLPFKEVNTLIQLYGGIIFSKAIPVKHQSLKEHKLPTNVEPLTHKHKKYLEKRNFDPDKLEKEWNLCGTGPISLLETEGKKINYNHRIIIPIIWDDLEVSFDSRDITGKSFQKYLACPKNRELIPHKNIIYGKQRYWGQTGICVEGYTDVWRMGFKSFATSGIEFTLKQIQLISKIFKRIFIVYDDGAQAGLQAIKLANEVKFRGVEAVVIKIKGDPGDMSQNEADYLVKQLIKR